jgi:hypothetical protein
MELEFIFLPIRVKLFSVMSQLKKLEMEIPAFGPRAIGDSISKALESVELVRGLDELPIINRQFPA